MIDGKGEEKWLLQNVLNKVILKSSHDRCHKGMAL